MHWRWSSFASWMIFSSSIFLISWIGPVTFKFSAQAFSKETSKVSCESLQFYPGRRSLVFDSMYAWILVCDLCAVFFIRVVKCDVIAPFVSPTINTSHSFRKGRRRHKSVSTCAREFSVQFFACLRLDTTRCKQSNVYSFEHQCPDRQVKPV